MLVKVIWPNKWFNFFNWWVLAVHISHSALRSWLLENKLAPSLQILNKYMLLGNLTSQWMMQFSWERTFHIILLMKLRIVQSNSSPKRHALTVAHACIWRALYSLWQPYCCLATSLDDCGQCLIHRCLDKEKKILFSLGLLYWLNLINW